MSLSDKQLESIEENDLQTLVDNRVRERKTIEYKKSLPGHSDRDKQEFLADVSSFANAAGGHLIFGIREEGGEPVELCGLQIADPDAEILRLENLIRDSIEPRIPGVYMWPVPLEMLGVAVIVRIARSWALPHVVKFRKHWRFYSRNSAGKYPLDVSELRAAFALSQTTAERIRSFRTERLSKIVAGETPVALNEGGKIVLHIIPFGAFDPAVTFDVASRAPHMKLLLEPVNATGYTQRHNFDGYLTYEMSPQPTSADSYLQIFRNGSIEAVEAYLLGCKGGMIPMTRVEEALLDAVGRYFSIQEQLGVEPPLLVMLSLLGVSGYTIDLDVSAVDIHRIDRDALLVPEVLVESFDRDPAEVMKPAFDAIWNAAGRPGSKNYHDAGKRTGQRSAPW
ncbi:MAG: ATP-binding protein [Chloroflexi bacterium]|nr:ATP-binding protein [Chloroflexota bacterium]